MAKPPSPARPAVVPKFGALLRQLREARSLTQGQVLTKVHGTYKLPLSASGFSRYEKGQTQAPDPTVLLALAQIYGAQIEDLLKALAAERAGMEVAAYIATTAPVDRAEGISDETLKLARDIEGMEERSRLILTFLVTSSSSELRQIGTPRRSKQ